MGGLSVRGEARAGSRLGHPGSVQDLGQVLVPKERAFSPGIWWEKSFRCVFQGQVSLVFVRFLLLNSNECSFPFEYSEFPGGEKALVYGGEKGGLLDVFGRAMVRVPACCGGSECRDCRACSLLLSEGSVSYPADHRSFPLPSRNVLLEASKIAFIEYPYVELGGHWFL